MRCNVPTMCVPHGKLAGRILCLRQHLHHSVYVFVYVHKSLTFHAREQGPAEQCQQREKLERPNNDEAAVKISDERCAVESCSLHLPEVSDANVPQSGFRHTTSNDPEVPLTNNGHTETPHSESQISFHLPEVDTHITADKTPQDELVSGGDVTTSLTDSEEHRDAPASVGMVHGFAPTLFAAPKQPVSRDVRLLLRRLDAFQSHDLFLGEYVLMGREHRRQDGALSESSWYLRTHCTRSHALTQAFQWSWYTSASALCVLWCYAEAYLQDDRTVLAR